ncbi:MAG: 2-oxoacid:acceptor oxidoreductase family protein [Clostridia bacterium]|nr:2-oxoacid:acceptor oxidoreductase family protein [Clostridia bacterium]
MMTNEMLEFRLHGRGGQGIVVAAVIFAEAMFLEGYYARAFSLYGAERRGAPVTAFIRASKERLMPRSRIYQPDYVVVFDSTLSGSTLIAGLKEEGTLLINSGENWNKNLPREILPEILFKINTIDAIEIAWKHKLTIGSFPMVNTVMLGALARISGLTSLENLITSIKKKVTVRIDANISAATEGYESVKEVGQLAT